MSETVETVDPGVGSEPQRERVVSRRGRRLMIAIIIILLLGLAGISLLLVSLVAPRSGVASGEDTGGIEWIKSIYGWGSTPNTQLAVPQELSIDTGGNIWVTDTQYADRVIAFTPEGKLFDQVGEDSEDRILSVGPVKMAVDGRLFLGESALDRVRGFDPSGNDLGYFAFPNPIDIDVRGDIMAIGSTSGWAVVNPDTGEPVKVVGTRGKGDSEFDTVNGIAIGEDETVYVVDSFNNRLSAYEVDGTRKWMVVTGAPGNEINVTGGGAMAASSDTTAPAKLQLPADVTIDGRGRLVVVDSLDFSISVFDPADGSFIAKYGAYGPQDGQFIYPSSIDYDSQRDWFAIADSGNSRIQIIRIPDSGRQTDAAATVRRALSGPLRACLVPLLLLLILFILFVIRSRKRKKEELMRQQQLLAESPAAVPEASE
jgi:hypothetical protein